MGVSSNCKAESWSHEVDFVARIEQIKTEIHRRMSLFSSEDERHPELRDFFVTANEILLSDDAKRLRCILPVLIADQYELPENDSLDYGIIVELLHYTSLVHDDVIDEGQVRRGCVTLNNRFSNSQAVLVGDYIICMAINYCLKFTHNQEVIARVVEVIKDLVAGIIIEQRLRPEETTSATYLEMAKLKTGSLFGLSFGLPFIGDDRFEKAQQCGITFGTLFQIYDDYLDRNEDEPGVNIFGLFSPQETVRLWNRQTEIFNEQCRELAMGTTVDALLDYLRDKGYFGEIVTEGGTLFQLPSLRE